MSHGRNGLLELARHPLNHRERMRTVLKQYAVAPKECSVTISLHLVFVHSAHGVFLQLRACVLHAPFVSVFSSASLTHSCSTAISRSPRGDTCSLKSVARALTAAACKRLEHHLTSDAFIILPPFPHPPLSQGPHSSPHLSERPFS